MYGLYYSDVNECLSGTPVCDENAFCINTDGSFLCNCTDGYTGSGDIGDCSGMSLLMSSSLCK